MELVDQLRGARPLPRLVLVAAPAGFGKTRLIGQWLAPDEPNGDDRPGNHRTRTRGLAGSRRGDADLRAFLTHLIAAVRATGYDVGTEARALLDDDRGVPTGTSWSASSSTSTSWPGRPPSPSTTTTSSTRQTFTRPGPSSSTTCQPRVTLALTTRADPPLPLARLRSRGDLVELRAADLRFTAEEADAFLNRVMGLDLDPALVAALEARTEGWAAGLQLAALSARGRATGAAGPADRVGDFVEAFTGSHRFVLDYLVEEVLDNQPEGTRLPPHHVAVARDDRAAV